jgi:hypothetical protein
VEARCVSRAAADMALVLDEQVEQEFMRQRIRWQRKIVGRIPSYVVRGTSI